MEDLLLILLGLVWLGLTLYRNSQKKKKQQQSGTAQQEPGEFQYLEEDEKDAGTMLEELFGESLFTGPMTDEEQEEATLVKASGREPFIRNKDITDPGVVSLETEKLEKSVFPSRYQSLEDIFGDDEDLTKTPSEIDEDVYNLAEEEEEETDDRGFDLRLAVIYSEILKRPEF